MAAKFIDSGWRAAEVMQGDTLQRIAARELGSADSWPEIAWLNNLLPPYLTGNAADPRVAEGRLILYGQRIKVPTADSVQNGVTPGEAFGVDIALQNGELLAGSTGDFDLVTGVPNLDQALGLRLRNGRGDLLWHPRYGNGAWRLVGRKLTPGAAAVMARFCEETVLDDPRVKAVSGTTVQVSGDTANVTLTAEIDGAAPLRLQISL